MESTVEKTELPKLRVRGQVDVVVAGDMGQFEPFECRKQTSTLELQEEN